MSTVDAGADRVRRKAPSSGGIAAVERSQSKNASKSEGGAVGTNSETFSP